MLNNTKKLFSFLLSFVILLSSTSVIIPVTATENEVALELNGGTLEGVSSDFTKGDILPNYEQVKRGSATFGGWYTNPEFTGTQVFTVPADITGNVTYYANWIVNDVNFDSFDSYETTEDLIKENHWSDWKYPAENSETTLNTDSSHALSGGKSMKVCLNEANVTTQLVVVSFSFPQTGDGIAFWVESTNGVKLRIRFNNTTTYQSQEISVSSGKQIVTIPWSEIPDALKTDTLFWQTSILVSMSNADDVVYIDEIGTYTPYIERNLTLNTNGGNWVGDYTPPVKCTAGTILPSMDNIEKEGLTFAGWYDNFSFTGKPISSVPDTVSGDVTYYARWVKLDVNFSDFEGFNDESVVTSVDTAGDGNTANDKSNGFITDEEGKGGFYFWGGVAGSTVQLNTDNAYANSGSKSAKLVLKAKDSTTLYNTTHFGSMRVYFPTDKDLGEGIAFWINTDKEIQLDIQLNGNLASPKITVPSGKQIVTIPWSDLEDRKSPWMTLIRFTNPNEEAIVYIDDIGTYTLSIENNVIFNTNGGNWISGYNAPTGYNVLGGLVLPDCDQIKSDGLTFAGWYDNESLTGFPVYSIEPNTTGNKEYWAKWVVHDVNFENFDSYDTTADMINDNHWSDWKWPAQNTVTTLNTDAAHAYNGGKSMKICPNEANQNDELVVARVNYPTVGDGIAFWIESTKGATVRVKFNGGSTFISQERTVIAGKRIVTIPWSEISGASSIEYFWQTSILVSVPSADGIVYIDEIGTYKEDVNDASTISYIAIDGVWTENYTKPTKYASAGVKLPTYEDITMPGYIFAGWYDNKDYNGTPLTETPDSGNLKLYAKRIKKTGSYDNFESYTDTIDWGQWTTAATPSLNTEILNTYAGLKSLKIGVASYDASKNQYASVGKGGTYNKTDDGLYFWIKSEMATEVQVAFDDQSKAYTINVPAGKSFVTIPWSDFTALPQYDSFWCMFIRVKAQYNNIENTVYVDDIGTYSLCEGSKLTFNTNGGSWADGYTAPSKYTVDGISLPSAEDIKKDRIAFGGWYDNEEFTGYPIYSIAPDTVGDKEYWANWIVTNTVFDNFDSYSTTSNMTRKWKNQKSPAQNSEITLNTDVAHTYNGGKSMKLCLNEANKNTRLVVMLTSFPQTGDGISVWIESTNGAKVIINFNGSSAYQSKEISVPAGKHFVTIPWSEMSDALNSKYLLQTSVYVSVPNADDVVYIDEIGTYKEFNANRIMAKWENGFSYYFDDEDNLVWNYSKTANDDNSYIGFATDYLLRSKDYVIAFDYKYLKNGNLAWSLEPQTVGNAFDEELIENQTDESRQTLNGKDYNSDWETKKIAYSVSDVTNENKYLAFVGKVSSGTAYDISIKNICFYDLGDVDFSGAINSLDLSSLRMDLLGEESNSEFTDVNNDGNTDARDLVRLKKKCVEYTADNNPLQRGVNFSGLEMAKDYGYDSWIFQSKYYDIVKEKGFDHIRLPVDFFNYMGTAPEYTINKDFLRKVDTIINNALNADLKIVLDFHHFGELCTNVKGNKQKYYKMWEQLAEHYQNYPSGLIFELINEPGNGESLKNDGPDVFTPDKIIEIQEEAIKIIRKTNPTRLIVHATRWNNGAAQLMDTEPLLPDDKNIIMSVHSYEPMSFTHQGADWNADGIYYPPTDFTDDMKAEIEAVFKLVKYYQEVYGRPVWIGEFGVLNSKTPAGARAKYAEFIVETMKDAECGWCWWEFKDGFGIYNISSDKWVDEPLIDALMK